MNIKRYFIILSVFFITSCTYLPTSGPSRQEIYNRTVSDTCGIQLITVNDCITRKLLANQATASFADVLCEKAVHHYGVGPGDVLEFSIWEVPPATLFSAASDPHSGQMTSRSSSFPEQMVNSNGTINVPFAGKIHVVGMDLQQIQQAIVERLKRKANKPQVLVKLVRNTTSYVTVVGEVGANIRMPLTPSGEHLLDAIATAGGTKQPISKMTVQVTRGDCVYAMPLDTIIRDPKQNIILQPGDVITALFQPYSFTVLGATGRNEEISFEAQGITLSQALGRSAGLQDNRADAKGVFIFRFEPINALKWPKCPVTTPDGKVAVIYRIDLLDPRSFFIAQSFPIKNKDILYVSNAPIVEVQKFLNVLISVTTPAWYIGNTYGK